MSSLRTTVIWVFIVFALVSYAYFIEYKGGLQKIEKEEFEKQIVPLKKEEIIRIELDCSKGSYVFLKENGIWNVKSPKEDLADSQIIDAFLSQLVTDKYEDVIAEGSSIDYSIYGFGSKFNRVQFSTASANVQIEVGAEVAVGDFRYVRRVNEEKVLLVSSAWEHQLERNLTDFISKDLVPRKENISAIVLKNKQGVLNFELTGGKWNLKELTTGDADQIQINQMHNIVRSLRATRFYKDTVENSKTQGIGAVELTLTYADQSPSTEIKLTELNSKNEVYVTSSDRKGVYVLGEHIVKNLLLELSDFRDRKKPFRFYDGDVEYIHYRSDIVSLNLQRDGEAWKSLDDLKGKMIEPEQVQNFLGKITDVKVKKFFDKDIPYQKSGMTELKLLGKEKNELLVIRWSPRPQGDLFIATSNLSPHPLGVDIKDLGSLPVQSIIVESKVKLSTPKKE